jgi:hypothetical protein
MLEPPKVSSLCLQLEVNAKGVWILDFAKAVKVELAYEGGEFVVFEELRDDVIFKGGGIFDYEGFAVFGPIFGGVTKWCEDMEG